MEEELEECPPNVRIGKMRLDLDEDDTTEKILQDEALPNETSGLYLYDAFIWLKKKIFPPYFKLESRALIKLGWGLSLNNFLVFFIPITMIFVVGHLGKDLLAAAGLGLSFCTLTGIVFAAGFINACDTLCSQAFGAGNYRKIGIVTQRAIVLSIVTMFPIVSLWINSEKILLALGQEPIIARLAAEFIECYVPALIFFVLFNIIIRFLACQGIVYPAVYASILATIVNGICCYLFMYHMRLGVRGGAYAVGVSFFALFLFLFVFMACKFRNSNTWQGWSLECFVGWREFLVLGLPSTAMIGIEWWCFEIGILILGIVGDTELATQIILYHVTEIIYFISFGLSMATAVRVGSLLGSGDPIRAKQSLKVALILINFLTIAMCILVLMLQHVIGKLFTTDRSVIDMTSKTVFMIGLVEIFDGQMSILNGGVRGMGCQKYGALINFLGYACIATPFSLVFIFVAKMGVLGFWTGILIGVVAQVICFVVLLFKLDWDKLSEEAKRRGGAHQESKAFNADEIEMGDNSLENNGAAINVIETGEDDGGTPTSNHCISDADVIIDNEKDDVFLERQYGKPSMSVLIKKLSIVAFFFLMLIVSIFIRIYA